MVTIEEMEGTPQTGQSLSRTIDSIISVVRQSRGEPALAPSEHKDTAKELKHLYHTDLAALQAKEGSEEQERVDLVSLRRALYEA